MGSNYSAVKCPDCSRSAFQDFYYNSGENYIRCYRCGYNYSKTIENETAQDIEYKEDKWDGHGVFSLVKKDGERKFALLNSKMTTDENERHKKLFINDDCDQEKSYLVSFEDGVFTILLGNPPENFHLSFEEYRQKMIEKYGEYEDFDVLVPIEE